MGGSTPQHPPIAFAASFDAAAIVDDELELLEVADSVPVAAVFAVVGDTVIEQASFQVRFSSSPLCFLGGVEVDVLVLESRTVNVMELFRVDSEGCFFRHVGRGLHKQCPGTTNGI
ncbi:hypothetical protein Drorol1_Dr00008301 [Drosera rotundifolia]